MLIKLTATLLLSVSLFGIQILADSNVTITNEVVYPDAPAYLELNYLDTWNPDAELLKAFPYYVTGVDKKGNYVFVVEYGKWNMRKYFEKGGDIKKAETYIDQMLHRFSRAAVNLTEEVLHSNDTRYGLIVDFDGYDDTQLQDGSTLYLVVSIARKFVITGGDQLDYGFIINLNNAAKTFVKHLFAPIIGPLVSRFQISGMNKEKWIPLLLERIPKESLPPRYGGTAEKN